MNLAPAILGNHAVNKLREAAGAAVLQVGTDKLTRGQLATVECYNYHAARMLTRVLAAVDPPIPNLKFLFNEIPPAMLTLPNLGTVSLAALGAAFEAKGIGDLETYVARHRVNGDKVVTFDTMKAREQAEVARERKDRKRRKGQRRNQAHEMRVERFTARQRG
jgi:hypothetical protein